MPATVCTLVVSWASSWVLVRQSGRRGNAPVPRSLPDGQLRPAAITGRHRSRVRGIALQVRRPYMDMSKLLRALSHPFPELENLEICPTYKHLPSYTYYSYYYDHELILPATFLSGSAPYLRRLTLRQVAPRCLSPLLSSTTGLVESTLTLKSSLTEAYEFAAHVLPASPCVEFGISAHQIFRLQPTATR